MGRNATAPVDEGPITMIRLSEKEAEALIAGKVPRSLQVRVRALTDPDWLLNLMKKNAKAMAEEEDR